MGGNREGALKFKAKILAKDPNYFRKMGKLGGQASSGYAFGHGKVDPKEIGKKGGSTPRRKKVVK